jgi:hypothetical protein
LETPEPDDDAKGLALTARGHGTDGGHGPAGVLSPRNAHPGARAEIDERHAH